VEVLPAACFFHVKLNVIASLLLNYVVGSSNMDVLSITLQKCERLSNARHHVQQKIREQFQLTKTEQTDGDGISSHIHTKVCLIKAG